MIRAVPSNGDTTAAYFALGGALGGAFIALVGAALQGRRDDRRLEKQLRHERQVADLAELRVVLDSAASAAWDYIMAVATQWAAEEARVPRDVSDESGHALLQALSRVEDLASRMALRLGHQHPITDKYRDFVQVARETLKFLQKPDPAGLKAQVDGFSTRLNVTRATFVKECAALVGAQLPPTA